VPAVEPGLPPAYANAGLGFTGANAYAIDFLRPYQGYSDIIYYMFDGRTSYNSLQVALQRRFSKRFTFGVAYTLSRANTTVSDDATFTNNLDPESFDKGLATFDRTHYFVANYVWNLPRGGKLLGGGWLARALLDNWTVSGISWMASGTPAELTLSIAGQDAGNRLLGTYTNGNGAGLQPRFRVEGDPQSAPNDINTANFIVPAIGDAGPYPRFYLRNPGFQNHDLSLFKNFRVRDRFNLQLRGEAYNLTNSARFAAPVTNISSPEFGRSVSTINGAFGRQVQRLQLGFREPLPGAADIRAGEWRAGNQHGILCPPPV